MAGIVGTITNLSDFLSKTQVCLSVKPNDPQQQIICLEADRKYSIPAFQREVRWDDNNLKMLLYDLSRSSKFLGNIILTIKSDHTCEIIDGQQRTTVLKASLKCVKRIRKKMERSSIENYDGYLQMKSDLNEQKSKCTQQLLEVDKELQELRAQKAISASKLSKAKSDYEALLKKQSINDISARALLAFDELQKTLYDKSIRLVETGFSQFFASLINKSDLIDGIHIDDSLNVLPYKNKHFKADEIRKIIGKNGVEYLIAQIGLYAYEVLQQKLIAGEPEFELPVEVKQQLSAGEKQIFIMALYQALSQLNKINVPYIVDTPFARIDKEHRGKILSQFFKKLNGQIIILSTDEEIVGEYRESISDIISNTFVLNHTANGNTEILANTYFGGKHND